MAIRVAVHHSTSYHYDRHVELSPQIIRLRPASHCRTPILGYSLKVLPEKHFINWQQDPFGNFLARIVFPEKINHFTVDVEVIADMVVINPFDFFVEKESEMFPFTYESDLKKQLQPYLEVNENSLLLQEWMKKIVKTKPINTIDYLVEINQLLNTELSYNLRMEPGVQDCEVTLNLGSGSCRDFSWLLVNIFRHLGLAARFVSGYLIQLAPDVKSLDGPSGPEKDFTDLHAWAEVFIPGAGWIGLDATSGLFAGEGHIPLSCTPNPGSAAPITGFSEPCETTFDFKNEVVRIYETPRVTKPYSDEDWEKVEKLACQVEDDLINNDVRLTMGGEPTFVGIDNMDAPEWNYEADGEHKRERANELMDRLKHRFGYKPLIQYGQGKWYPGEPLPRWKLASYWRKDGEALWHNEEAQGKIHLEYNYKADVVQKFATSLSRELHITPACVHKAFEDIFYFLWQEKKVPVNVDPLKYDLKSSLERQKLAELLQQDMAEALTYIIPIHFDKDNECWQSCQWKVRSGNLYLIPGNSPAGLRLPLDTIEHIEAENEEPFFVRDQFQVLPSLTDVIPSSLAESDKALNESVKIYRTAICLEIRKGKLYVFMPPLEFIEHYISLLNAVENVATRLGYSIFIEGYDPPNDYRVEKFQITPDPGVIEVNIHPSSSWKELADKYAILYEEARLARLGTEKFNLDGHHTGTGGGNHVTLGARTPADSPLLRRPDLLQSLVTFWQHHPSLSYLFSTQFIGPTSQAPRMDEGRPDMLFEMEIAFDQVPNPSEENIPFWLVDRIFRNLLVDVTGNTHRAEFCIDKLYSPDTTSGRLGILEFRGFDMPPHYRMCMVQILLVRALVAAFWKKPYRHKLVRWGTELHDKFLLPHYCRQDIREVIEFLNTEGYEFNETWLDAFFEFRFPKIGELQINDVQLELYSAIEPWHVLGEEVVSTGTSRFVDSSLERIQVKLSGLTNNRYYLLCNGLRVPFKTTATKGEYVTGIRYRAWQPYSALHPTIGIDTPLTLDLYDTWNKKIVGGCRYHVTHPAGRNYQSFPVNSYEAEARRVARFFDQGHTIQEFTPVVSQITQQSSRFMVPHVYETTNLKIGNEIIEPDFPFTMDLRRYKKRN